MRLLDAPLLILLPAVLILFSCADDAELTTERIALALGESTVELVVHRSSRPGLTYLNLHDNEDTSVEAGLSVLREYGGTLFELSHDGDRNLTFRIGDSTFTVDPNRIFTGEGIDSTLAAHSSMSPRARDAVRSFADALLHRIGFEELPLVVTLHNNSDDRYSILSYTDEGELADDARFTYVDVDKDPDDFFYVTSEAMYTELRDGGYNVVMQDIELVEDDGSLSVHAGRQRVPYVNVEAQHGHLEEQREMIEFLHDMIVGREA